MNPASFLLQLLPLLVFIVADAVFNNPAISIVLAIVTATVQLTLFYIKTRKIDWFILLDAGLIIALGAVSILLENDLFFKLKPAIINAVAIIIFVVFIFSPDRFLTGYFGRLMPEQTQLRPGMIPLMKKMLGWMCLCIALHGAAVLYSAFKCSRKTWAFVAGPGFYVLFIPVMVYILLKRVLFQRRLKRQQRTLPQ